MRKSFRRFHDFSGGLAGAFQGRFQTLHGVSGRFEEVSKVFQRVSETLQSRCIGIFGGFGGFLVFYMGPSSFRGILEAFKELWGFFSGFTRRYKLQRRYISVFMSFEGLLWVPEGNAPVKNLRNLRKRL